jgi:hypothetical protein
MNDPARSPQSPCGDVIDVQAIDGTIQISAVFGDNHYILRGTATEAA